MTTHTSNDDLRVVVELAEVGITVGSVFDLVNAKVAYPAAIPILLNNLSKVSDPVTKEGLVRALSVKEAAGIASQRLIQEFLAIPPEAPKQEQLIKWAIGNALSVVATDADRESLVTIATDKRHGKAREMIVVALGRMKDSEVGEVLVELLDDDCVAGHAAMALRKLRYHSALQKLRSSLEGKRGWVRKEIEKTIEKLSA